MVPQDGRKDEPADLGAVGAVRMSCRDPHSASQADPIPSGEKRDEQGRFIVPPVSPGRPKGSRNKLGEAFCADVLSEWEEHGRQVLIDMREKNPGDFAKMVASMLSKEMNVRINDFDDLTDEQLARQLAAIATQLAGAGIALGAGTGSAEAPQQADGLPTLQ
jgi:hypothetical protein